MDFVELDRRELRQRLVRQRAPFAGRRVGQDRGRGTERRHRLLDDQQRQWFDEGAGGRTLRVAAVGERTRAETADGQEHAGCAQQAQLEQVAPAQPGRDQLAAIPSGRLNLSGLLSRAWNAHGLALLRHRTQPGLGPGGSAHGARVATSAAVISATRLRRSPPTGADIQIASALIHKIVMVRCAPVKKNVRRCLALRRSSRAHQASARGG